MRKHFTPYLLFYPCSPNFYTMNISAKVWTPSLQYNHKLHLLSKSKWELVVILFYPLLSKWIWKSCFVKKQRLALSQKSTLWCTPTSVIKRKQLFFPSRKLLKRFHRVSAIPYSLQTSSIFITGHRTLWSYFPLTTFCVALLWISHYINRPGQWLSEFTYTNNFEILG